MKSKNEVSLPPRNPHFRVKKDRKGEWRFSLVAPNGEKMDSSEGYKTRAGCLRAIERLRKHVAEASIHADE